PLTSVNVSNVAGPAYRCYHGGAEMVRSYPLSTLAGGTAINITFTSMCGRMDFAVIADAKAIPGTQEIADFILEALKELEAVTVAKPQPASQKKAAGAKKISQKKAASKKAASKKAKS
ncbi:MAG: WS/DGAT domain-containing protein, partial [Halioglobus sp.]